jgi:hypothetical protein
LIEEGPDFTIQCGELLFNFAIVLGISGSSEFKFNTQIVIQAVLLQGNILASVVTADDRDGFVVECHLFQKFNHFRAQGTLCGKEFTPTHIGIVIHDEEPELRSPITFRFDRADVKVNAFARFTAGCVTNFCNFCLFDLGGGAITTRTKHSGEFYIIVSGCCAEFVR